MSVRCNIFIGVRIIKEMPGSVASGTLCIKYMDPVAFLTSVRASAVFPVDC